MIQIKRLDAPEELTADVKKKLTEEFKKDNKKAVWNKPYIKKRLLEMSNDKCCYCEELVGTSTSDMHVEHYHDKKNYPDEVVEWVNLLPSCAYCNKKKSTHDTYAEPIVNPTVMNPLSLNDSTEKVTLRFMIGDKLNDALEQIFSDASELGDSILTNIRKRNRIIKGCVNTLRLCTKKSRYGACMATVLQENDSYHELKKLLHHYKLWDDEMENLHQESLEICLCQKSL